jgi:hypothetical protein
MKLCTLYLSFYRTASKSILITVSIYACINSGYVLPRCNNNRTAVNSSYSSPLKGSNFIILGRTVSTGTAPGKRMITLQSAAAALSTAA